MSEALKPFRTGSMVPILLIFPTSLVHVVSRYARDSCNIGLSTEESLKSTLQEAQILILITCLSVANVKS